MLKLPPSAFQDLEKRDSNPEKSDDETEKKGENDEEEVAEEEYNEEDIEEVCYKCVGCTKSAIQKKNHTFSWQENDYIDSYFDNGEDFAAGSDDNMDGEATY